MIKIETVKSMYKLLVDDMVQGGTFLHGENVQNLLFALAAVEREIEAKKIKVTPIIKEFKPITYQEMLEDSIDKKLRSSRRLKKSVKERAINKFLGLAKSN